MHETTLQPHAEHRQRFDRFLEGRTAGASALDPAPVAVPLRARGEMRQRMLTLLRDYPDGLSPAQTRQRLGIEKDVGSTMQAMLRDGFLRRVARGQYTAAE